MEKRYQLNECSFELPPTFEDQSVNIFRRASGRLAIVFIRDDLETGDTIDSYAARQLKTLSSSLGQFKLLKQNPCQIDHRSAIAFEFSWTTAEGPVFQRQVMLLHRERALVITATEPGQFQPENEIVWREVLASILVRR